MKVIIISGSRNPDGQTARAAAAFARGLSEGGHETETVFLPARNIERCRQCANDGWGLCRKEGRCVIQDDFAEIVDKLNNASGAVFATPVYFSDLSESIRSFLDRLRRITMHDNSSAEIKGKPAAGIAVAGGGGGGAPACIVQLEKITARCGFDVADLVPVRRQNLEFKTGILISTGAWFASLLKA
ncbi:MAG: flavodoxin family protein [Spirochaetia bacterium]